MLDKARLSKRAIVRKLETEISEKDVKEKFNAILDEKGINRKVSLVGKSKELSGYLDKKIRITKKIGKSNSICSYIIFREIASVPLLRNVSRFNYGIVLIVEYKGHLYSYLEAFPNIVKWLDEHTGPIGISKLKKVFAGAVEFKKISIRNPKPSMFEVSGLSMDGHDIKSNIGVFGKERQVLQRITSGFGSGALTLDINAEKIQVAGAREGIAGYLKWIDELSKGLEATSKVRSTTNSFFDGFMKSISESELNSLVPTGFYVNESILIKALNDRNTTLSLRKISLESDDIGHILLMFNKINKLGDFKSSVQLKLLSKDYVINVEIEKSERKKIFDVKITNFPNIFIEMDSGRESLISYLLKKEAFGISFNTKEVVQLGTKIFKSVSLKDKVHGVAEILKPKAGFSAAEYEKYKQKSGIKTSIKFPVKSVFYQTEEILIAEKGNKVFLDDLGNEWCDYLSYNLSKKEVQFIHCKFKAKPKKKDYSVSASNFQDVLGQAQKNIGNILHGHELIKKKFQHKFVGKKYKGSKINMDRNSSKLTHDKYLEQYESIYHSPKKNLKVIIAINFISKRSFVDDIKNALYESDPFFWQQVYFIISASEFYKQQGVDFEVWCGS